GSFQSPLQRAPRSTLFPYPALFRSVERFVEGLLYGVRRVDFAEMPQHHLSAPDQSRRVGDVLARDVGGASVNRLKHCVLFPDVRSEEHTSELLSRENLVCRLLLEKK